MGQLHTGGVLTEPHYHHCREPSWEDHQAGVVLGAVR